MDTKKNILDELLEVSPLLATIGNHNVYTVPDGYFIRLPNEITEQVNAEYLFQTNISTPFNVPAGYFDGLANNILLKIKTGTGNEVFAELKEIAPLLTTIDKRNVYTVPPSYFENFSPQVNAEKAAQAKVFNIFSGPRKRFSYAVAAAVIGILLTVALFNKDNNNGSTATQSVSDPYAATSKIDVKERISDLSDGEIADYLDTHSSGNEIITSPSATAPADDATQHSLNNASDDDIQQYLDSTKISGEKSPKGI